MKYLLDANVFIQAHRSHYSFDVFPSFWEWLIKQNQDNKVFSIQEIYEELEIGKDELWDWVKKQDKTAWFLPVDDKETQRCFKKIAVWIMNSSQFKSSAKNEFLSIADPWLIAKALTGNYTVVTYEKSDAKCRRKVYIPDVCNQFQVPYMNTLSLLRKMGMKF